MKTKEEAIAPIFDRMIGRRLLVSFSDESKTSILDDLRCAYREGYEFGLDEMHKKDVAIIDAAMTERDDNYDIGYDQGYKDGRNDKDDKEALIAYQKGLEDAWEAARKLIMKYDCNDVLSGLEYKNVFDIPVRTAMDRLEEYIAAKNDVQEIKLGDEVEAWDTNKWVKFIASGDIGDGTIVGFDLDGGLYEYPKRACRKTGKKFEVEEKREDVWF